MSQIKPHINPFPGIRSFETDESHLFFGRENQVEQITSILTRTHFIALTGYSGSGKSSLIRAGVIPSIINGGIHSIKDWIITIFKPGDRPISSFAEEYAKEYNIIARNKDEELITNYKVRQALNKDPSPIFKAHERLDSKPWLIVIDQFEEIFRYHEGVGAISNKGESIDFVKLFLDVVNKTETNRPIYVILTMRSDFLDQCTDIQGLIEAINIGHFLIPRMSSESLHRAIVNPLKENGDEISEDLVNRLIADLGDQTDQLPVMQHALMRAWDYWIANKIGNEPIQLHHYENVGTITSALSIHAEEIYNDFEKEEQKLFAEKLFKSLTYLGSDKIGTRRPTSFDELVKITGASVNELTYIIDQFRAPGRAFLMPPHHITITPNTIIDIAHESLMRVWTRLKEWGDEETKSAELYLRLSRSAELYQQGKTGLWTNPELEIAVNWKNKNKPNAFWAERYNPAFERAIGFLDYSKSEYDFEIKKKENRQKRELNRARKIVIFLSVASIISILFLIISLNLKFQAEASENIVIEKGNIALEESKKAEEQRKEAIAQKRIAEQQQEIAEQQKIITEEQRQYAIAQQEIAKKNEKKALQSEKNAKESELKAKESESNAKESEAQALISKEKAEVSKAKAIASEKNSKRLRLQSIARSMAIHSLRMSGIDPQLAILLAAQAYQFSLENEGRKDDPDIFNALSNTMDDKPVFRGSNAIVRSVAIAEDGNLIFSGGEDGRLLVWDSKNPELQPISLKTNGTQKKGIRCLASKNNAVVAGTENGFILFWDKSEKSTVPVSFPAHNGIINKVEFISNNKVISAGADGFIKVWDLNKLDSPVFSDQLNASVSDISICKDGTLLAYAAQNGQINIHRISQLDDAPNEINTGMSLRSLALNSKGNILITGDANGMIKLWNLENTETEALEFLDHRSAITALVFNPDDQSFASSSYDNTIRIWNPENYKQNPIVISNHDSWVMDIAYSADGNKLVSASNDKTIKMIVVNPDLLSSKVCSKVDRNLSENEWITFVGKDIDYKKTCSQIRSDK